MKISHELQYLATVTMPVSHGRRNILTVGNSHDRIIRIDFNKELKNGKAIFVRLALQEVSSYNHGHNILELFN